MISTNASPPIPLPVQVPPGHVVQQIVDETGTLRHVILSAQPVPMPMCPYVSTQCWLCWPELSVRSLLRCFLLPFLLSFSVLGACFFLPVDGSCFWSGKGRGMKGTTSYRCVTRPSFRTPQLLLPLFFILMMAALIIIGGIIALFGIVTVIFESPPAAPEWPPGPRPQGGPQNCTL